MKIQTKQLTQTALMLALATALSMIPLGITLPFGGTVTPFSMVPIILIAVKYDKWWGLSTAVLYAVIQGAISFGVVAGWGLTWYAFFGSLLLDYLLAYSALGIIGFFGKSKKQIIIGTCAAMAIRYACHIVSGVLIFNAWMVDEIVALVGNNIFLYSITYNAFFFGPEAILTLIGVSLIPRVLHATKE